MGFCKIFNRAMNGLCNNRGYHDDGVNGSHQGTLSISHVLWEFIFDYDVNIVHLHVYKVSHVHSLPLLGTFNNFITMNLCPFSNIPDAHIGSFGNLSRLLYDLELSYLC